MTYPENTKLIPLTQGKFAIVDVEDYEWLMQWKWHTANGYANRNIKLGYGKTNRTSLRMHKLIMNTPNGKEIDHINGNRLDNRRCNLRVCEDKQNSINKSKKKNCTSKYKGVYWSIRAKKWQSSISISNKKHHLGYFDTETDAALAYNEAAKKLHGEYGRLNEIQ